MGGGEFFWGNSYLARKKLCNGRQLMDSLFVGFSFNYYLSYSLACLTGDVFLFGFSKWIISWSLPGLNGVRVAALRRHFPLTNFDPSRRSRPPNTSLDGSR